MNEKVKFKIESIQRSKIIMAVEATAVNTSVIIGIYLVKNFLPTGILQDSLIISGGLFGICYALYASLGNFKKHIQIISLEKLLNK